MAIVKCVFHKKDSEIVVKTEVKRLTPGDRIVFNPDDTVLVDPGSGCVDLVVNHALEITAELDGRGEDQKFVVSFNPIGGGGGGEGSGPGVPKKP